MAPDDERIPSGEADDGLGPLSADLKSLINSCSDVEEFRALLASRGIWLNRKAAESAFATLRREGDALDGDALDDDELGGVVGGVNVPVGPRQTFIDELLRVL